MRIFKGKDYKYLVRKPVKEKNISAEYVRLAKALKSLVDTEGQGVYADVTKLEDSVPSAISAEHVKMITTIAPQIRTLLSNERFVDDETVTEQMYCALMRAGYSRNIISGLLYAVYFSLNKTLRLSGIERQKLRGEDVFSYQYDAPVNVNDNNLEEIKSRIEQDDNNAKVELGVAILNGKLEKVVSEEYAKRLLEEGLNHGSGKAAQVLGDNKLVHAVNMPFLNDNFSQAYEYYTIYGAVPSTNPAVSHSRIIDILNLGLFHQKMMLNYIVTAILFSVSFFIPHVLSLLNLSTALVVPIKDCVILSLFEMTTVIVAAVVRYIRPFFTQGWVVFLQFLIWFIAMIIMIP